MNLLLILGRILHIVLGAVWVGFAVFVPFYLMPALQDVGPEGSKVMAALQRRGLITMLPIIALITLLSGIFLFWRVSLGFGAAYMGSRMGIALSIGGLAGIVGYAIGMTVVRPSMLRAATLSEGLGAITSDSERAAQLAAIGALRVRGAVGGKLTAILLLIAVTAMAVARYV